MNPDTVPTAKILAMTRGRGTHFAVFVLVGALAAALGGCAATAGDGNIVDDWAEMPAAKPKVPASGVCYASSAVSASRVDVVLTTPIPCSGSHVAETFHVGQFPAEVVAVPLLGRPDYLAAYEECQTKAGEFLGDQWFNGRTVLRMTIPLTRQWEGGGRWFRCELIETQTMYEDLVVQRTGSLAGAMAGAAPLAQHCATLVDADKSDETWDDLSPIDCATPHDAEFVGAFKVPGVDQPTEKQYDDIYDGCWNVLTAFMNGTRGRIRVGYLSWAAGELAWKSGDHWVRCYAWSDKKMVGSVKGIGNAEPKH